MIILGVVCALFGVSLIQVICDRYACAYHPVYFLHYIQTKLTVFFEAVGKLYAKAMSYITLYPLFEYVLVHYRRILAAFSRLCKRVFDLVCELFECVLVYFRRVLVYFRRVLTVLKRLFKGVFDLVFELCDTTTQIIVGVVSVLMTPLHALYGYYTEISTYRYSWLIRYLGWALLLVGDYLNDGEFFAHYHGQVLASIGIRGVCPTEYELDYLFSLVIKCTLIFGFSSRDVMIVFMSVFVATIFSIPAPIRV